MSWDICICSFSTVVRRVGEPACTGCKNAGKVTGSRLAHSARLEKGAGREGSCAVTICVLHLWSCQVALVVESVAVSWLCFLHDNFIISTLWYWLFMKFLEIPWLQSRGQKFLNGLWLALPGLLDLTLNLPPEFWFGWMLSSSDQTDQWYMYMYFSFLPVYLEISACSSWIRNGVDRYSWGPSTATGWEAVCWILMMNTLKSLKFVSSCMYFIALCLWCVCENNSRNRGAGSLKHLPKTHFLRGYSL